MYRSLTLILFSLLSLTAFAQQHNTATKKDVVISGTVLDKSDNSPLEFATVSFFSKSLNKTTTGGIVNEKGKFNITVPTGTYNVTIEFIAYKSITLFNKTFTTNKDLGTYALEISTEALEEVEIIAENTTVEIKLDKKIYNVGKDLTVSGGTVNDVLNNVPSISVDAEGGVSLRGNESVRILINGKPSGLVGLNSAEALKQLPAESIEKVEVITSPSARYDAEGSAGIINIILRRSKLLGFNGSLTTNMGYPSASGTSGTINYRTKDINIFNTTGSSYRKSPGNFSSLRTNKNYDGFLEEKRVYDRTRKNLNTNFGIEWYITDSASLTGSVFYGDERNINLTNNNILNDSVQIQTKTLRFNDETEKYTTLEYNLNYTKNFKTSGHKLTADFQYEDSGGTEDSFIKENNTLTDNVLTIEDQNRILIQSDYVHPIGEKTQFEAGYRGNFNNQITDYSVKTLNPDTELLETDADLTNLLDYKEYVNAVYSQFGSKFNKFSFLLGLRYENTSVTIAIPTDNSIRKNNYDGLFPTANLNYELSEDKESISLGYSRRLSRPRSWHINYFPSRTSLTNVFQGNPNLNPSYSSVFDIGYLNRLDKITVSSSLYYRHSTDVFEFVNIDTGETVIVNGDELSIIRRFPINLSTNDRYGFEFTLSYKPSKKLTLNSDFNIFQSITEGTYENQVFDNKNISWFTRLSSKYTLPHKIEWQTNLNYRGPRENAQRKRKGFFVANIALSKDVFKEKASIAFNVKDVFNSRKRKEISETEDFFINNVYQWRERSFNLSFTYRFNQKKKVSKDPGNINGGNFEE